MGCAGVVCLGFSNVVVVWVVVFLCLGFSGGGLGWVVFACVYAVLLVCVVLVSFFVLLLGWFLCCWVWCFLGVLLALGCLGCIFSACCVCLCGLLSCQAGFSPVEVAVGSRPGGRSPCCTA